MFDALAKLLGLGAVGGVGKALAKSNTMRNTPPDKLAMPLDRKPEDASFVPGPQTFAPLSAGISHMTGRANPQDMSSADGVNRQVQGSWPNLQVQGFNPQGMQGNLGLQPTLNRPDTSYTGGPDSQAGFPISLLDFLNRR